MPAPTGLTFAVTAASLSADLRVAAPAARRLGFAGLLLDATSPAVRAMKSSATAAREVRHVLSSAEQRPVAVRADLTGRGLLAGADVTRALSSAESAMDAARKLAGPGVTGSAVPVVCIDLGPLPNPPRPPTDPSAPPPAPATGRVSDPFGLLVMPTAADVARLAGPRAAELAPPDPADADALASALPELAARADRHGVTLALSATLAPLAALEHALKVADAPPLAVNLDPAALQSDALSPEAFFDRLGPLVRHVRARDAARGTAGRSRPAPVGTGDVDWPELLALLRDADYRGAVTLDPADLPAPRRAAASGLAVLVDATA